MYKYILYVYKQISDQHLTETSDSLNSSIQINQNKILLSLTPAIQEEIQMELRMPNKTTVTKILAQQQNVQIAFQRKATPENRKQDSQFMTLFPSLNLEQIRNNNKKQQFILRENSCGCTIYIYLTSSRRHKQTSLRLSKAKHRLSHASVSTFKTGSTRHLCPLSKDPNIMLTYIQSLLIIIHLILTLVLCILKLGNLCNVNTANKAHLKSIYHSINQTRSIYFNSQRKLVIYSDN
ncbi:Hypothetical_protein [Hexamita inflata]|uniref:Hypothetical_protein n=1 Tax=Hexamita inflata TaxID=28002 RepID=A0AA86VH60_9EUKA|nr:Hypothetical protein HINF_LOCUS54138 [Hexamita inflata]